MGYAEDVEGFAFSGRAGAGQEVSEADLRGGEAGMLMGVFRYAHVQAQQGEKGERPWAAFDVDVSLS